MFKLALKIALLPVALPLLVIGSSTYAFAEDISVSVSVDAVSEYVFRGVTLAGTAVQPGVEFSTGGFTLGAWTSLAIGDESIAFGDELDLYAGYSFDLSDTISADIGATLYHYPQLGGLFDLGTDTGDASTFEIYAGLGFDAPLAPSVTAYYDLNLKALTLEAGGEYSFPLAEKTSFDVGATAGAVLVDGGTDYQYGQLSGAFSYGFTDTTSAYIGINLGLSSEDTFTDTKFDILDPSTIDAPDNSSVWFGIGISSGF
ncbi:MAG TPA: hypothetical protein ENJ42_07040 [Hellea balneolensis]|uniref:Porin n=1 Tax=Hellea balneolensis TaxID=287478 RepID=A0A7C5M0I0_9PROT|nr:hypothetical protein [Hellea balneolensis]